MCSYLENHSWANIYKTFTLHRHSNNYSASWTNQMRDRLEPSQKSSQPQIHEKRDVAECKKTNPENKDNYSSVSCSVVSDLCNPTICPKNSLGKNTGVGCHSLLQGIFQTQQLNRGLLCCRQILYCLSYQGSSGLRLL